MEKQDNTAQDVQQVSISREDLKQHVRARAWKDDAFRQEFLANPQAVLQRDFAAWLPEGKIPSELTIKVVEEEVQSICFVIPTKYPEDTLPDIKEIEDEELSALSGGATNGCPSNNCTSTCKTYGCGCSYRCKSVAPSGRIENIRL